VPAYLVGAALTPAIVGLFALQRTGYAFIGIVYGAVAAVVLLISAAGIRERGDLVVSEPEASPLKSLGIALRNRPFLWLCGTYFIVNIAFAFIKTLMAYFLEYQLLMKEETSLVMGLMLICVTLALPLWQWAGRRMDKGPAYGIGMAIGALAVALTYIMPNRSTGVIYVIAALAGIGFSAQWIFPWAMVADVADYDRVETGEQRSGMYYGVWGLATKISEAFALAAVGWILTGFGYVPNVAQSARALLGIRLFFGLIPAACIFAALPLLFRYPITRKRHAEVRRRLDAIDGGQAAPGERSSAP
jgi:GPH family glycoside/pentoside/hexuronide:cation symporter